MTAAEAIVKFGRFRIDSVRRILLYDGKPVPLQHRAFDIFEFLATHGDRFVSREEIEAHVWHGLTVGENNLRVQMSLLRRALTDCGAPDAIVTRPGVGYRFVGEMAQAAPEAGEQRAAPASDSVPAPPLPSALEILEPTSTRRLPWRGFGAAGAAMLLSALLAAVGWHRFSAPPAPPRLSIAVLPFRNLSDGHAQDYLADAITDDLTTDLSHIPGSVVIARESAEAFAGRGATPAEIGQALHVRYLLAGSLRSEDGGFHINARLVDTSAGSDLWAERFDTKAGHLADARNAIVRRIASGLDVSLTEIEVARSLHDRPDDADAQDMFFQARSILEHDDSLGSFNQAQQLLEQATTQQPGFGDAWAELALTLVMKLIATDDPAEDQDLGKARAAVAQALALVPRSAVALAASARLQLIDGNCEGAASSAKQALQSEPNSLEALAVLAKCAMRAGRLDESVAYNQEVLRLNPESPQNKSRYLQLAQASLLLGRYDEAVQQATQALEGDAPATPGAGCMDREEYGHLLLIAATDLAGDRGSARDLYAAYNRIWPHRSVWRVGAYVDPGLVAKPGFARFLAGLHDAGMPVFVDEHVDDHVAPSATPRGGGDFDATPTSIPGARSIDTTALAALLKAEPDAIVIDLGRGEGVIPGAAWNDPRATIDGDNDFIDRTLASAGAKAETKAVIVMATGTYGAAAYDGALHLVQRGCHRVYWYRGGEEAWVAAGRPAEDRRPK